MDKQFSKFEIHGNSIADKEAQSAALRGRESKYEHPESGLDDLGVHKTIMNETARLIHDIQSLFPREYGPLSGEYPHLVPLIYIDYIMNAILHI